jgi:hypothetical protein
VFEIVVAFKPIAANQSIYEHIRFNDSGALTGRAAREIGSHLENRHRDNSGSRTSLTAKADESLAEFPRQTSLLCSAVWRRRQTPFAVERILPMRLQFTTQRNPLVSYRKS